MTRITTKLTRLGIGLGFALSLVALPLVAGAAGNAALLRTYPHHRFLSEEVVWRTQDETSATAEQETSTALNNIGAWASEAYVAGLGANSTPVEEAVSDALASVGAWANDAYVVERDADDTVAQEAADYAMLELNVLERIAGRTNLDLMTIRFLEANLEERDYRAESAREADDATGGVYAIDLHMFSDEIFWQDRVEPYAEFAQAQTRSLYPHPDDVPQLRQGEANY